jgi:hypothetical protein
MAVKRFLELGIEVVDGPNGRTVRVLGLRSRDLGPRAGARAEVSNAAFRPVASVVLKDGTTHKHKVGAFGGRARNQPLEFNIMAAQAGR